MNTVWAIEGDLDVTNIKSNTFELEWPPKSGKTQEFPEIDRAQWFDLPTAKRKIRVGQLDYIRRLEGLLKLDPQATELPKLF